MAEMTDEDLLALIHQHEKNSIGNPSNASGVSLSTFTPSGAISDITTVEIDRYNALNYYYGRPFGNEKDDRSQIVVPVVRDVVEWMRGQLLRMFAGTTRICQFDAEHPGDEQLAELATTTANYVFMKQNPGFHILNDAIMDALLLKNYYLKAYWDKKTVTEVERYSGLTQEELALLQMSAKERGDTLEFLEQEETSQLTPQGQVPVFAVKVRRTTTHGEVRVECVPPEEMRVSVRARNDMEDVPFIAHCVRPTRSDLIEMGYDAETVEAIPRARPRWVEMDQLARDDTTDEMAEQTESDPATVEVDYMECYLRCDYDGDGVAELRRVCVGGNKILDNEEVAEHPFATGVPLRMSHRHLGLSIYDTTGDLQQIHSMLMRQYLDNLYLANDTRTAVNENTVNFDDLLTNRPGGVVRVKGEPQANIMPLEVGNIGTDIIAGMGVVDKLRTLRTGVGESTLGLDPDALQNVTAAAASTAQSSATVILEGMARNLGDGLKDIFRKINSLLIRHQEGMLDIQSNGQWIQVDPSSWRHRERVTVNVGLGSGNRQEMRQNAVVIGQAQAQGMQMGLVGPRQAYNTSVKLMESMGWENGQNQYFLDPNSAEYKQLMQMKSQQVPMPLQIAKAKAQADAQAQAQSQQLQIQKIQAQTQAETAKNVFQAKVQGAVSAQKAQMDAQTKAQENAGNMELETMKAKLNLIVELASAALKAQATGPMIEQDTQAAEHALNE